MASKPIVVEAGSRLVRNICVYCGSAQGAGPSYEAAAQKLGQAMAKAGIGLVYGGGANGLMGAIARSVLASGGHVTGIIPNFLVGREGPQPGIQECLVAGSMHERKRLMFERADAFVALPGGIGTLEELTEQLSWVQLERHTKPVVLADIAGFWQPLLRLFAHMRDRGYCADDRNRRGKGRGSRHPQGDRRSALMKACFWALALAQMIKATAEESRAR
jgi:uncharacterized protein (TIGR00730 family)